MKIHRRLIVLLTTISFLAPSAATAAENSPAEGMRPITVRVIDESGAPMPGAKIHSGVWTNVKFPPNSDYITDA